MCKLAPSPALPRSRRRDLREGRTPSSTCQGYERWQGLKKKEQEKAFFPVKLESRQREQEPRSKTTKGPSSQLLPVLIKQRVLTPTPTPSNASQLSKSYLSRPQLSLQRTGSLREMPAAHRGKLRPLPLCTQPARHRMPREGLQSMPWTSSMQGPMAEPPSHKKGSSVEARPSPEDISTGDL